MYGENTDSLTTDKLRTLRPRIHGQAEEQPASTHIPDHILIFPHDDELCGRILEMIRAETGAAFPKIGQLFAYIQDVLGFKIQGADASGIWWQFPPQDEVPAE